MIIKFIHFSLCYRLIISCIQAKLFLCNRSRVILSSWNEGFFLHQFVDGVSSVAGALREPEFTMRRALW